MTDDDYVGDPPGTVQHRYWVGGRGARWDEQSSWSTEPGGRPGVPVPGPADLAFLRAEGRPTAAQRRKTRGGWRFARRFGWNNWTFGVWWSFRWHKQTVGVDLGPLELWWERRRDVG